MKRGRKRKRSLAPLLFFALLVGGAAYLLYRSEPERATPGRSAETTPPRATPLPRAARPTPRPAGLATDFESAREETRPAFALVLDDVGFDADALRRLAAFDGPLALAVIPSAPHAREAAALAARKHWDVLVHLPMVPESGSSEEGAVGPEDGDAAIATRVGLAIDGVPGATGLNNHQGSRATADARVVRAVLQVVGERGLFFLDSRTTAASVGETEARRLGIRTVARDVFLDDAATSAAAPGGPGAALQKAWESALATAAKKGSCVLIGHPHKETLDFLAAHLSRCPPTLHCVRVSALAD